MIAKFTSVIDVLGHKDEGHRPIRILGTLFGLLVLYFRCYHTGKTHGNGTLLDFKFDLG